ncbi:MAG: D-alanyl-D-alanine carboxypeptidase/D-alanyl-D-alanine-endopeptidase [Acidimicrobiales bacterium]
MGKLVAVVAMLAVACSGRPVARPRATPPPTSSVGPKAAAVAPPPTPPAPMPPLDRVLADTNSCLVVTDAVTGAVRYDHHPDVALAPASTQKLLVAVAALARLGPDYRFVTTVVARRGPLTGAVDDLWLVGGGDPLLASAAYAAQLHAHPETAGYEVTPLSALADAVATSGVRVVRGSIHGDDGRYERSRYLAVWPADLNQGEFDVGPLSALEVDQGLDRWRPAVPTPDPAAHAVALFAPLLRARGLGVLAGPDSPAPAGGVIVGRIASAPLEAIVAAMLKASDNQIAELLVRELDRQSGGTGTTVGGLRVVAAETARHGVPTRGLNLVDGSGLSALDHATCRTLLATLDLGGEPRFAALSSGLPVAGVDGSLATLFRGTPAAGRLAAGRLAAKGGYITGVTALVGRLAGPHPVRFAFVANGPFNYTDGVAFAGRVVEALLSL